MGKGSKPLFRAGRRRCLTCVPCYPGSYCSAQGLKSTDCSWRQQLELELTAGSDLYRALPVMMFRICEYQITLSSSSVSWEGRKNQIEGKYASSLPYSLIKPWDVESLKWLLLRFQVVCLTMEILC